MSFLPLYIEYEKNDYKSWGVLWPLFSVGKGPKREKKRILPFYAHSYKENYYNNYSILMIFNYRSLKLDRDEQNTVFVLPVFGKRWNRTTKSNSSTLLWPLFSWGYSKANGNYELNFPWPLVQIRDCKNPNIYKRIFFPFYGKYLFKNKETFFITPFYFTLKEHTKNFRSEYYINALIFWYFRRDYKRKPNPVYGSSWRYYKLWPIFHLEYDDRGNYSFNFLSLLPWRDPEGYERLYQPFWTIFEYRTLQSGEKRLGFLLRLYYQRWGKNFLHIKIPFIFSYLETDNLLTDLSFLLSMFGYSNEGNRRFIRIFWIPIDIGEGSQSKVTRGDSKTRNDIVMKKDKISFGPGNLIWAKWKDYKYKTGNDIVLYSKRVF